MAYSVSTLLAEDGVVRVTLGSGVSRVRFSSVSSRHLVAGARSCCSSGRTGGHASSAQKVRSVRAQREHAYVVEQARERSSRSVGAQSRNAVLVAARNGPVERIVRDHLGREFDWCCVTGHNLALRPGERIERVRLVLLDVDELQPDAAVSLLSWLARWPEAVFVLLADRGETVRYQQFGQLAALVLLKPLSVHSLRAVARAALR